MIFQYPPENCVVFFLTVIVFLIGFSVVLRNLIRRIDTIPIAYAWNPNSHDKMTSYAVDILKKEEKPTLMGWVLKSGFNEMNYNYFLPYVFEQLRRGSIDEDMNSDLWKSRITRYYRKSMETPEAIRDQAYEGTNGAYHFYNPITKQGLTGVTENLKEILKALWEDPPIPSAVERATIEMSSKKAFLDNEARNYTQDHAEEYFKSGYYHLSFYSIGRISHLLQDMAVPAHVRNSGHANRKDEPPEPLEYYADYRDGELLGSGRGKEFAIQRWTFDNGKYYIPSGVFTQNNSASDPVYTRAAPNYQLNKGRILRQCIEIRDRGVGNLMHMLATYTHKTYYSYGTIPWNADSRDPENFDKKFEPGDGPNLSKCQVNPGALLDIFSLMVAESNKIITFMKSRGEKVQEIPGVNNVTFSPRVVGLIQELKDRINDINSYHPQFGFLDGDNKEKWGNLKPLIKDLNDRWNILDSGTRNLRHHLVFYQDLNNKVLTDKGLRQAMEAWMKEFQFDKKKLMEVFKAPPQDDLIDPPSINRNWHQGFHGPYCLVNNIDAVKPEEGLKNEFNSTSHIIHNQYIETQSIAIHFTGVLLSTWFEDQFTKTGRGLGLWINKDGADNSTPPEQGPLNNDMNNIIVNKKEYSTKGSVFTMGIMNHLPIEIDIDLTITLHEISEMDQKEFPDGIPLNKIIRTDFIKGKSEKHAEHESNLKIKANSPITIKKVEKLFPYNISAVKSVHIPFSGTKGMGGIKKDDEKKYLFRVDDYIPLAEAENLKTPEPIPEELEFRKQGLDQPACVVIRFKFGNEKQPGADAGRES